MNSLYIARIHTSTIPTSIVNLDEHTLKLPSFSKYNHNTYEYCSKIMMKKMVSVKLN